jgi:2-phosphosulfolactate phosphatase
MKHPRLEVLFTPAEFSALTTEKLRGTTCVVFDVLRATSSITTALAHGAAGVLPVATIPEALAIRQSRPEALLGGERGGFRILAQTKGGVDFDFGNSPREFATAKLQDRLLVVTTTNGTRALQATRGAAHVLIASFLNLSATIAFLRDLQPVSLLLIGAGTYEEAALEDTLAAGAVCDALWTTYTDGHVADSAKIARILYRHLGADLAAALAQSRNGSRLIDIPELRDDVAFAAQQDAYPLVAWMDDAGLVTARDAKT